MMSYSKACRQEVKHGGSNIRQTIQKDIKTRQTIENIINP